MAPITTKPKKIKKPINVDPHLLPGMNFPGLDLKEASAPDTLFFFETIESILITSPSRLTDELQKQNGHSLASGVSSSNPFPQWLQTYLYVFTPPPNFYLRDFGPHSLCHSCKPYQHYISRKLFVPLSYSNCPASPRRSIKSRLPSHLSESHQSYWVGGA